MVQSVAAWTDSPAVAWPWCAATRTLEHREMVGGGSMRLPVPLFPLTQPLGVTHGATRGRYGPASKVTDWNSPALWPKSPGSR